MNTNTLTVRYWWTHGEHHSHLAALLRRIHWHAALAPAEFGKRP